MSQTSAALGRIQPSATLAMSARVNALKAEGEVLMTDSLSGISEAFRIFTSTVTRRIEATTKVSPRRQRRSCRSTSNRSPIDANFALRGSFATNTRNLV